MLPVPVIMVLTLALVAVGAVPRLASLRRDLVPEVAPHGSALTRAARVDLYQDAVNEGSSCAPAST